LFEIEKFCEDCRLAMKETDKERAVRDVVTRAVSDPAALMKAIGEPQKAGVNTLHRSDDLTVLNLIWGPEMALMPHDHSMWAVIGIYQGREENTFYRRSEEDGLTKLGLKIMDEKDCSYLGETAIHGVYNPLTKLLVDYMFMEGTFLEHLVVNGTPILSLKHLTMWKKMLVFLSYRINRLKN